MRNAGCADIAVSYSYDILLHKKQVPHARIWAAELY